MKKIISFLICLLTVQLFASNLLENSSFEIQREANSARPETWTALNEKNLPDTYSFEEKDVFSGKRAVKISNKSGKLALWMHSHLGAKLKKLPAGTEMELSAFVRSVKGPLYRCSEIGFGIYVYKITVVVNIEMISGGNRKSSYLF